MGPSAGGRVRAFDRPRPDPVVAVELSLLLPHHPVDLRRERGVLLVAGGDFAGGARELVGYARATPSLSRPLIQQLPSAPASRREQRGRG